MDDSTRLAFIAESLDKYMVGVVTTMKKRMQSMRTIDTKDLYNSLSYRIYQQNADGNAQLSFAEWGRFLDMGVRKGHPLGGIQSTKAAMKAESDKKHAQSLKPRKIYSPVVYGKLNGLMGDLSFGFTEEIINRLKQMQHASPNTN